MAAQAFTTLSIITLVAKPLTTLSIGYPMLMGAAGCFTRLQNFLLLPDQAEHRFLGSLRHEESNENHNPTGYKLKTKPPGTKAIEMYELDGHNTRKQKNTSFETSRAESSDILFQDVSFAFDDTSGAKDPTLQNVTLTIPRSSFSMVVGAVGSGKSALLKAILGEIRLIHGTMHVEHADIAYCGQNPGFETYLSAITS